MPTSQFCSRGHLRTERPNGDLVCRTCHNANRESRQRFASLSCSTPRPSRPTDDRCPRGHKKVVRSSGNKACCFCEAARRRELRRLAREGQCPHAGTADFDGVLSLGCRLVCLTCLAQELAA